jgi:ribonuclease T
VVRESELYLSVDIEAAGPVPGTYSMLSLGACVVGGRSETFYAEFKPINGNFVPEALEVVGKQLDDFERTGREPAAAMRALEEWLRSLRGPEDRKVVFVGFNATFDWAFVSWYFHTFIGRNPLGIGGIDIKSFFMGMAGCSWAGTRSSRLPERFKPVTRHSHHALDDAIEQAEIFERMLVASRGNKLSQPA